MLKVTVVGPGLMGKQHIDRVLSSAEMDLCSIVAPSSVDHQAYAQAHGVPIFSDLKACIAAISPDGVIIASPNEFHTSQAAVCVDHATPFLLEKPLATTQKEGRDLWDLVKKAGFQNRAMVGHHRSHGSIMRQSKDLLSSGVLGRIVTVQGSAQFFKPESYFEQGPWRSKLGGGPILLNMIHEISNLRALLGEIEAVQVISSSEVRGAEVEDTAVINLRFESGTLGSFVLSDCAASSKSWEMTSGENPSYPFFPNEYCYVLAGTKGSLEIPSMAIKTYGEEQSASWMVPFEESRVSIERVDPLQNQMDEFVELMKGDIKPTVTIEDGYRNLAVVEAINRAAQNGSLEKVEY